MLTAGGALGLGVSLYYIHIYVTPLKRFVQVVLYQHRLLLIMSCAVAPGTKRHWCARRLTRHSGAQALWAFGSIGAAGIALTQVNCRFVASSCNGFVLPDSVAVAELPDATPTAA